MTIAGVSAASFYAASSTQSSSAHKQGGHSHSLSDIDSTGSSAASSPSPTGKTASKLGSKVDFNA